MTTRRTFIAQAAGAAALASAGPLVAAARRNPLSAAALDADIRRYDGFGVHRTGSAADHHTTRWLDDHMRALGFTVERRPFAATLFEPPVSRLVVAGRALRVFPQEPFASDTLRLSAPLRPLEAGEAMAGAIAYVRFPYARDASLGTAPYAALAAKAAALGASALVAVTEGPTGDLIVFNTPADGSATPLPILLLAPREAASLVSGIDAHIEVVGRRIPVTAYNTVARLDRGTPHIVISTPQRQNWLAKLPSCHPAASQFRIGRHTRQVCRDRRGRSGLLKAPNIKRLSPRKNLPTGYIGRRMELWGLNGKCMKYSRSNSVVALPILPIRLFCRVMFIGSR